MSYLLTKSKYIRGLQCIKALYLDVYQPKLARYDRATLEKFKEGRSFEASFKATFPMGIDISDRLGWKMDQYAPYTHQLLEQEGEVSLFEAGFEYDKVLVLADVVHKLPDGSIDIYEVKNNTEPKDVFRRDVAIQHYVISHCLPSLNHFYLLYNDGQGGFIQLDLVEESIQQHAEIAEHIAQFKEVLGGFEPDMPMDEHCDTPYECPYKHYCKRFPQA